MAPVKVVVVSTSMPQYGQTVIDGPGQVIELEGLRNDHTLMEYRYFRKLTDEDEVYDCQCGRKFVGTAISGPARGHLERARHDQDGVDLDSGAPAKGRRKKSASSAESGDDSQHPLETEGAAAPTKPTGKGEKVDLG